MNPFNLYWKSSWAASSLASPPGNTTRHCKRMLAWRALSHWQEEPDTSHSMSRTLRGTHANTRGMWAQTRSRSSSPAHVLVCPNKERSTPYAFSCITQGGALPSSATLVVSLKLLQWLRVSMEASSSLKGCTCPCCPPGGGKRKINSAQSIQMCLHSLHVLIM